MALQASASDPIDILVTNDDGIAAEGLEAILLALFRSRKYNLFVVAPSGERSAASHSLTIKEPVRVTRHTFLGELGSVMAYAIDGTPADCVMIGVSTLAAQVSFSPKMVISGINKGDNLGGHVIYSGTVAGARQGALMGLPSIALSLCRPGRGDWPFAAAAEICVEIIDSTRQFGIPPATLLNVNVPPYPKSKLKGIKVCRQEVTRFEIEYVETKPPEGSTPSTTGKDVWLKHRARQHFGPNADAEQDDLSACSEGFVTVTPLGLNQTSTDGLAAFREWVPPAWDGEVVIPGTRTRKW